MTQKRRLSATRIFIALTSTALIAYGCVALWQKYDPLSLNEDIDPPWFASYVDVTATPTYVFEETRGRTAKDVVLSFVVADPENPCKPTWGTYYDMDEANESLELDRRIARLRLEEGDVAISFGGQANQELATTCKDASDLEDAYRSVVERYELTTIDLDIEGEALSDRTANERRALALASMQRSMEKDGHKIDIWVTLPVNTGGLTEDGKTTVQELLDGGVELRGVNAMTMNFGQDEVQGGSLSQAISSSLRALHTQIKETYTGQNVQLSDAAAWRMVGMTPMIGQNDVPRQVLTITEAESIRSFASRYGVGRTSLWSANRDQACGVNYIDTTKVSDSCSGVEQESGDFERILSTWVMDAAPPVEEPTSLPREVPQSKDEEVDDPALSPYPIWTEDSDYVKGFKVVWKHNVYEAKWWTQNQIPDMPVEREGDTPWRLIGPVLPDDKPQTQASVPDGVAPDWSGTPSYDAGDVVYFDGQLYRAKWWTQGDSPAASSFNPGGSPWAVLSQKQMLEYVENAEDTKSSSKDEE
jgi:Uncharacterized protein contain chitin-binding domain type 3